ncbi:MAG: flagellar protein FlgN [Deltaproteobacteria bacterium]|nr:flagellar protein FlgN [Deltaproteobacteria bacterium]
MESFGAIKKVLGEQIQGCRQLLELLQREKLCLLDLQMEGVEAIIKEKDILVLKLRLLEEERVRLFDRLVRGNTLGILKKETDPRNISLLKLAEISGEAIFQEMRSKLISLSQSIKELNTFNQSMIDRTLGFLKKNNQFLGAFYPGSPPLCEKGQLLSREM